MEPISTIIGRTVPLPGSNIDTDQIMPKQHMKRIERTGYGEFVFGTLRQDPEFVLNKPERQGAQILVTGPNFGCGSSREHAPWGLQDWGFRAIIAPSFADIFYANCTKIGLLPIAVSVEAANSFMDLAETRPDAEVFISLPDQVIRWSQELHVPFDIDPSTKWRLTEGLDDIGLTLRAVDDIEKYEASRSAARPSLTSPM